jgi:hypothetical protein
MVTEFDRRQRCFGISVSLKACMTVVNQVPVAPGAKRAGDPKNEKGHAALSDMARWRENP